MFITIFCAMFVCVLGTNTECELTMSFRKMSRLKHLCPKDITVCSCEKPVNTIALQIVINHKSTKWICTLLKICSLNVKSSMNVAVQRYEARDYN